MDKWKHETIPDHHRKVSSSDPGYVVLPDLYQLKHFDFSENQGKLIRMQSEKQRLHEIVGTVSSSFKIKQPLFNSMIKQLGITTHELYRQWQYVNRNT